ncbi:MAG: hypothetical protein HY690_06170 [Chloroflexi bacterium]|nr:hypothetical protein [Chloroflexota bacterium]
MIARSLFALVGAAALLLASTLAALAWSDVVEGQPALTSESPAGYYLWHDQDGMHLRTHGPGDEHAFVAYLRTDGLFEDVDTVRLESQDDVAVLDGGHTLALRFHTYDYTDGVNFRVRGGTRLRLNLQLDGQLISTDSIYLGAEGHHPEANPFTIFR